MLFIAKDCISSLVMYTSKHTAAVCFKNVEPFIDVFQLESLDAEEVLRSQIVLLQADEECGAFVGNFNVAFPQYTIRL
jgi:hypothetical protein